MPKPELPLPLPRPKLPRLNLQREEKLPRPKSRERENLSRPKPREGFVPAKSVLDKDLTKLEIYT